MHTIDRYRAMLPVFKHRLDDELEIQPQVMDELSRQVVILNSRMIDAKDSLAQVEGKLAEDIRDDEPKLTVGIIDAKVKRDPTRRAAWNNYQKARSDHEEWSGLLDAWRHKGYSMKTLADLYAANYFSLDTHQSREKHPERTRANNDDAQTLERAKIRRASNNPKAEVSKESEAPRSARRSLL